MPHNARPSEVVALVAARYELVRELRLDADVVDWEGFDAALDRQVVVQLLRPELAGDPAAVARFWQVARDAARKRASVGDRVLDGGTDPETGQLFVVREWAAAAPAAAAAAIEQRRRPRWLVPIGLLLVLIVAAAAIRPAVEGWQAWVNTPLGRANPGLGLAPTVAPAQPGDGVPTLAAAAPTAAPAVRAAPPTTTVATAVPTPLATAAAAKTRRIVNTDGRGVALRATPGGDRLPGKGYDEGATVQALEQSGEWTHIRGSDGREGWVLTVTLAA